MKGKSGIKTVSFIFLIILSLIKLQVLTGCANIIPPAGGPRDTIPPRLLEADPHDSTVNFKGNRITLLFDEYVDLQDVQNNLLFTPTFENNPVIQVKGKTINIKMRDTLTPNTTYIFNFGNALRDINEGNILKDFTYTFSTGPVLDSLELSGKVILAETGGIDTTLMVVLHRNLKDSAVMNQRPEYVVKLDGQGNFHFKNLPADSFAIYAIGDAGYSKKYQTKNQLFAFANHPVMPGKTDSLVMYAYREVPSNKGQTTSAAPTRTGAEKRLTFTTNTTENRQDLMSDFIMNFTTPLRSFDSTKIRLTTDSIYTPATYTATLDTSRKELRLRTEWKEGTAYNLVLNKDFATDTLGRQLLKADTLTFTTKSKTDYGSLAIRIRNLDTSRNPVLLFIQNNQIVLSAPIKSGSFSQSMFVPGDYELRILYDTNNNGKWDPGQFFGVKRQPELVKPIEQKITVKPAWDNEFERTF
jgi:hypothetical protein